MASNIIHSFSTLAQHDKSRVAGKHFFNVTEGGIKHLFCFNIN